LPRSETAASDPAVGIEDVREQARELSGAGAREAFERGLSPVLLRAFDHPVASALVVERAPAYVTILHGLLLLRRDHELEPLHEDVERLVAPAARALGEPWDEQLFARDLAQLESWGCIERRAEPLKIRGYKDVSRERYRYRLGEDALAMLEWLEARLQARLEGRTLDSRDLLIDVVGAIRELARVVRHWHAGDRSEDAPRRALHLLTLIDERVHAIGEELLGFRGSMITFASRPYDLGALREILSFLERYVRVYLARIETLRSEIAARLDELAAPRLLRALGELHELLSRERAETPSPFRAHGVLRDPGETLEALRGFFAARGRLTTLCARIDESARAVLRKMHRHLKELERRSARLEDLRARMSELSALPAEAGDPRLAEFANALVGSAHGRFATRRVPEGERLAPPLPRRQTASGARGERRPLREKALLPETARALRARRLAELGAWIERELLAGKSEVRLSAATPSPEQLPRRWLDTARARHLDRGRDLARLRLTIDAAPGEVALGSGAAGLLAGNCTLRRTDKAGRS
jgi:hypothetical protein